MGESATRSGNRWASGLTGAYVGAAWRLWGRMGTRQAQRNPQAGQTLARADLALLPEEFYAVAYASAALLALLSAVATAATLAPLLAGGPGASLWPLPLAILLILVVPALVGLVAYASVALYPEYRLGERRRRLERDLPYAVNYIAAMSSAGAVPAAIFRDLGRQPVYGEVSREMARLARDLDVLGLDLLSALTRAIARSPSPRLRDLLQGAKMTLGSGGGLQAYFIAKAEQFMNENRRVQKEYLSGLGLLAEAYVTVVIAGPLFMLVLLSAMLVIGHVGSEATAFLFLLSAVLLPASHVGFAWLVKNTTPEV